MNTKNRMLSIVLSVLLALSACGPLAAYLSAPPVAYAEDEIVSPDPVPEVYPCSVCGVNPVGVPGGVCASCSAAPKSSITLSAAGGAVANPVEYNIYKLFSADVDDETGMASNIGYGNYPMEVKIGSCVASSSKENKIWSGVAGSYGWGQQSISATGAVINDYSTGIAIPTSVENYSSYFGATVEISIG